MTTESRTLRIPAPRSPLVRFAGAAACSAVALALCAPRAPAQCPVEIVSDPAGVPQSDFHSRFPSLSFDGRFVAFESAASNLGGGDSGLLWDIFVRDRNAAPGTFELTSIGVGPANANGSSHFPDLSSGGRWVAFESAASNLAANDVNPVSDVFRRDRTSAATILVSASADQASYRPSISDDGRYVAFETFATTLLALPATDTNGLQDVYLKDLTSNAVTLVSKPNAGGQSNGESRNAAISNDGRWVAFESRATNLTGDTVSGDSDLFVFDRLAASNPLIHVRLAGGPLNAGAYRPSLSADGRFLAFDTYATNLPPAAVQSGAAQVFTWDRVLNQFAHVSRVLRPNPPPPGNMTWYAGNADSRSAAIDGDGGRVAFYSFAANLVLDDTNLLSDLYTWERATNQLAVQSRGPANAQSDANAVGPAISRSGLQVAWHTYASTLLAAGTDTNVLEDVYKADCTSLGLSLYCFGDGTGTACPCANVGLPGNGCPNSGNPAGASLSVSGNPSRADDSDGTPSVVLRSVGMIGTATALYFQGTAQENAGNGTVFGDGKRCAAGTVIRLGAKLSVAGTSQYPDLAEQPIAIRGAIPPAGGTRFYQCWYRNSAASFCPPALFNLTNGVRIVWGA